MSIKYSDNHLLWAINEIKHGKRVARKCDMLEITYNAGRVKIKETREEVKMIRSWLEAEYVILDEDYGKKK